MLTRQRRFLEEHKEPIARNLHSLRVTYSVGRDFDREIHMRVIFVREALGEESGNSDYLLRVLALYFSFFYNLSGTYHVATNERGCGFALDANERALYLYCDGGAMERAAMRAETLREERVMVNNYRIDEYSSALDKRVYSILAYVMNIESCLHDELRAVSTERTLAEMALSDERAIRGRCGDFAFDRVESRSVAKRPRTLDDVTSAFDAL